MRTERLLHHEGKTIAWRFLRAAPGPGLAPHIAGYTDYDEVAAGPVRRRELPETGVVMIINLGAPLSVADPRDPSTPLTFPSAFLAGLTDSYTLTETTGTQTGVQVNLTALGARRIFGLDLSELTNRVVPLEEIVGARARRLVERLAEAPVGEARWRILDSELGVWSERGRERARAAGAEIVVEPFDTGYGSRDYAARDPEGHLWCFGTYRPEAGAGE